MTTQNGVPADPNINPAAAPLVDISGFMNTSMPTPSEVERQGAIRAAVADVAPPLETPVAQPHIEQPAPMQPVVPQPAPTQPVPEQPQPQAPSQPDLQKQINDLTTQVQSQKTVYEAQRTELETQQQAAQTQQIVSLARDHATKRYQQYINAGVVDTEARNLAMDDYQSIGSAYTFQAQQHQANTQAQAIATQYGINPQDIPAGLPQQAMEQFASMRSEINRLNGQTQTIQQNQATVQSFDSGVGSPAGNPAEQLIARLGDPRQVASPQDMAAWTAFMNQTLRR